MFSINSLDLLQMFWNMPILIILAFRQNLGDPSLSAFFPDIEKYHTVFRGNFSPQQKTFETGIKCHTVHLVTQTGAAIELESPDVILGVYVVFPDAQWPVAHDTKNNTK